jgi:hypothetical protein
MTARPRGDASVGIPGKAGLADRTGAGVEQPDGEAVMVSQRAHRTLNRPRAMIANTLALFGSLSWRERLWIRRYYELVLAEQTFNHRKRSSVKGSITTLHVRKKQLYHRRKIS